MKLSQYHIYIILFTLIAFGYVAYIFVITIRNPTISEHFTSDSEYASRLEVIKVFDGYLHRNPTVDEIKKYSSFINEHDILTNVMKDFKLPELVPEVKLNESESLIPSTENIIPEKEKNEGNDEKDNQEMENEIENKNNEESEKTKESFESSGIKSIGVGSMPKKTIKKHIESVNKAIETISTSIKEISQLVDDTL